MQFFNADKINMFLGVVRKYMQVRGGLSQKELAELVEVGVSSMSRFLNQKTKELDEQLIAKMVAKLDIPLHEIIDFITEDGTDKFRRLVRFYKDEPLEDDEEPSDEVREANQDFEKAFSHTLGTAQRTVNAKISVGGKKVNIPFEAEGNNNVALKDKLERLTPRQKAYISDFLNLDLEGRDLMVDLGNALLRYFRQKDPTF